MLLLTRVLFGDFRAIILLVPAKVVAALLVIDGRPAFISRLHTATVVVLHQHGVLLRRHV